MGGGGVVRKGSRIVYESPRVTQLTSPVTDGWMAGWMKEKS